MRRSSGVKAAPPSACRPLEWNKFREGNAAIGERKKFGIPLGNVADIKKN